VLVGCVFTILWIWLLVVSPLAAIALAILYLAIVLSGRPNSGHWD
jgi:hypothetical protein